MAMVVTVAMVPNPAFAQQSDFNYEFAVQIVVMLILLGFFYIIPTIVAFYRIHPNRWFILVINVVFGGTGIGWLGSLLWAFSAAHLSEKGSNGGESGLNLFVNDPQIYSAKSEIPENETLEKLEKLQALHVSGAISELEFNALKQKIITSSL